MEGNTLNEAFSEVYDIIINMEESLYNKIPKGFIKMIKDNRNMRIQSKYRLY